VLRSSSADKDSIDRLARFQRMFMSTTQLIENQASIDCVPIQPIVSDTKESNPNGGSSRMSKYQ